MNGTRTAVLLPCLLTGGTEVATLETACALKSLGYTTEVIVYFDEIDPAMMETFKAAGVVLHLLGVQRGDGMRSHWQLAVRLLRVLRRGHYDAIWLQYMTPTLLPLVVARLFTRSLITTVHVAASHYSSAGLRRLRWLARYWCTRIVCVSHTVANGIFGPDDGAEQASGRVVVIPNAVDLTAVRAAAARDWRGMASWPREAMVVGYTGRLAHIKGPDVLLRAVARLHSQGLPVHLVIVGDGAEGDALNALTQQLGIGAITHFSGRLPRAEIYGAIKGFDIAAVPSREEGFGLSALEAMACGVPLLASRVDALQEVVVDGKTGLLFAPEDDADLARKMCGLLASPARRKALATQAAEHAEAQYGSDAFRENIDRLIFDNTAPVVVF